MPVRAANAAGSLEDADIVDAIEYACDNGADVVNGSFGAPQFSQAIADAVTDPSCADTLFAFAAGNSGWDLDTNTGNDDESYPCELHRAPTSAPNALCIAATGPTDAIASFSNRGTAAVHLAAPGSTSAAPGPGTRRFQASLTATRAATRRSTTAGAPGPAARRLGPADAARAGGDAQPRRLADHELSEQREPDDPAAGVVQPRRPVGLSRRELAAPGRRAAVRLLRRFGGNVGERIDARRQLDRWDERQVLPRHRRSLGLRRRADGVPPLRVLQRPDRCLRRSVRRQHRSQVPGISRARPTRRSTVRRWRRRTSPASPPSSWPTTRR